MNIKIILLTHTTLHRKKGEKMCFNFIEGALNLKIHLRRNDIVLLFLSRNVLCLSISIFLYLPISKVSKFFLVFYMVSIFFLLGIFIFNSHFLVLINGCLFSIVKLIITYPWESFDIFVCKYPAI